MLNKEELRKHLLQAERLDSEVLQTIHDKKWLQIWVPKEYNGLGCSLSEGLEILKEVSQIDGSLGWMVTLCSGANYFSRNLLPETASKLFRDSHICFGGGGMLGGTAEKEGDKYLINGLWNYATGAPFLTHFTLNAQIVENGLPKFKDNGEPEFLSFVLEASQVELIPSWKSMGMVATASHSFKVKNQYVSEGHSFIYNQFYTDEPLNRVPFETFADLTLLINYLGMAYHFLEKSREIKTVAIQDELSEYLAIATKKLMQYAIDIEQILQHNHVLKQAYISEIHSFGEEAVENLMFLIVKLYQRLGIKASVTGQEINQVFRDFFTATQHMNFRKEN